MDRYTFGKRIGGGSFADVFHATHTLDGVAVAIKRVREYGNLPDYAKEEAHAEISALSRLDHPNCIRLLDNFTDEADLCLVLRA